MKYNVVLTPSFKKDLKLSIKRGRNIDKLKAVVDMLQDGLTLPAVYKDHQLKGNFNKYRELHVEPDWLLIYSRVKDKLILTLIRTGTHSDLLE